MDKSIWQRNLARTPKLSQAISDGISLAKDMNQGTTKATKQGSNPREISVKTPRPRNSTSKHINNEFRVHFHHKSGDTHLVTKKQTMPEGQELSTKTSTKLEGKSMYSNATTARGTNMKMRLILDCYSPYQFLNKYGRISTWISWKIRLCLKAATSFGHQLRFHCTSS